MPIFGNCPTNQNKVAWIRLKVSDSTSTHISKSKTCFKNLLIRSFRCLLDKTKKMSEFLMQTKTFLRCQKIFWHQTNTPSFQNYEGKANSLYKEPSFNERLVVWCKFFLASEKSFCLHYKITHFSGFCSMSRCHLKNLI